MAEPQAPTPYQYASEFSTHYGALVLAIGDDFVRIGLCRPDDEDLRSRLVNHHKVHHAGRRIEFVPLERSELLSRLNRTMGNRGIADMGSVADVVDSLELGRLANDSPIVNMVNAVLLQAFREGASDIHIEAQDGKALVRFRVDGALRVVDTIPMKTFPGIASRIKVLSQLNIMERRLPQDGRFSLSLDGTSVDVRVSVIPTTHGESVVLRLLHKVNKYSSLQELGFERDDLEVIDDTLDKPHGLILATGPTGSGKTTTLHAMIKSMPVGELKIVTLEDPVEYQIAGISQVQMNEAIGLTFDSSLRRVLRQDPDIILVGEIRDLATAELTLRAALTGHMVLSTLHTNDSLTAVPRLIEMGVEPFLLQSVLRLVIAQRLVRSLCPHCRAKKRLAGREARRLKELEANMDTVWTGVGCERCDGAGYKGQLLVYEVLTERHLRGLDAQDLRVTTKIRKAAGTVGFRSMRDHALGMLLDGRTSAQEVTKAVLA